MRKKEMKAKGNKFLKIVPVLVVIVLIVILMAVGSSMAKKKSITFWSLSKELINKDHTSFSYTITMNESAVTEATTEATTEESTDTTEEGSSEDTTEVDIEFDSGTSTNMSDSWTNSDGVVQGETSDTWQVTLNVNGNTAGDNSYMTVSMKDSPLFEYYHVDGVHYIGVADTKNTLVNSGISDLIVIGQGMPDGVQWISMTDENFCIVTGFNEGSGQGYLTNTDNAVQLIQDILGYFVDKVSEQGTATLTQKVEDESSQVSCEITDGGSIYRALRTTLSNGARQYDTTLAGLVKSETLTEEQKALADTERDNVLSAFMDKLSEINSLTDEQLDARNLTFKGSISKTSSLYAVDLSTTFTKNDKSYIVYVKGEVKDGDSEATITAPEGNAVDLTTIDGGRETYKNVYLNIMEYFNVFDLPLSKKLNVSTVDVSEYTLNNLVTLINNEKAGTEGFEPVNRATLQSFIEANQEDPVVVDLTTRLGVLSLANEVTVTEVNVAKFPTVVKKVGDIQYIASVDKKADDMDKKLEVTLTMVNKSSSETVLSASDFSLQGADGSKISANNLEALTELYGGFDAITNLQDSYTIPAGMYSEGRLYFVTSKSDIAYDLYYKDKKIGTVETQ
jgi:hypothetical protein